MWKRDCHTRGGETATLKVVESYLPSGRYENLHMSLYCSYRYIDIYITPWQKDPKQLGPNDKRRAPRLGSMSLVPRAPATDFGGMNSESSKGS